MILAALQVTIVYLVINVADPYLLSWQCLNRPIVVAPIAGLVLGDFRTGIIMGASLESIFMGISAIGGQIPADATTSSILAVAFTVLSGSNIETGLGLALPIGTIMASFNNMLTPIWASLSVYWERLALELKPNKFTTQVIVASIIQTLVPATVLFLAVAFGVEGLSNLLAVLPGWVITGLGAASGMMLAIGFAILTSMIWENSVGYFFFVGYILVAYLGLDPLPIAIIGGGIALLLFMSEKQSIDLKNTLAKKVSENDEEDFF